MEDVTAADGTTGRQMENKLQTALTLPTANPELYRVKYVSLNIEAIAGIGHDIDPNT